LMSCRIWVLLLLLRTTYTSLYCVYSKPNHA
jgi:hypothetical protein